MLERYQIVRELGSGAMAQVSLALDTRDRKLVALKRLHRVYAASGGARLRREFRALSSLSHPNIVRVFDHGEADGTPYLALEFVDGVTLAVWFEERRSVADIVRVCAQIADALEAAHGSGLIHRDLKPENVMVTSDGAVKLMDFGLTKLLEASIALTREGAMVGTALYMSPEQCRGQELDARADVYALGAVLYCALTSEPPFLASSVTGVILQHLNATPRSPRVARPDVPEALEALVLQMLAKEPSSRPRSALEVATRLRAILEPNAVVTLSTSRLSESRLRLLRAPLIGRVDELRVLHEAVRRPEAGYVAVVGEAGSGKTRLLRELETRESLIAVSASSDDTRPFALVERLVHAVRRDAPEVLTRLEAGPLERLSQLGSSVSGDAAVIATQRFEAFRWLLEAAAPSVVLGLENLQWADASTLAMLAHGLRGAARTRLIVSYRPEDIAGQRPRLLGSPKVELRLSPLSAHDMRALLEARLGGATEVGLRDALLDRAGGNPWALEELLLEMISRDAILEHSGVYEWDRTRSSVGALPMLGERLRTLAADPKAFAEAAAVLGREFQYEDARALLDWDDDRALEALEALLRVRVLLERPSGDEFGFAHPSYVTWLRAQIPEPRARSLHALAFERLTSRADDFALAEHALRAALPERALTHAVQAGESALKRLHYSLAERAFRLALDARALEPRLPEPHAPAFPTFERRARFGLAEALNAIGQPEDAQALWTALKDDSDEIARQSRLRLAEWHVDRNEVTQAMRLLEDDSSLDARLARARAALRAGETALAWREALSAYRLEPKNAQSLLVLTNVTSITGAHRKGLLLSRAAARRSDDLLVQLRARNFEASALVGLREFSAAEAIYTELTATAERIGHLWLHLSVLNNFAIILFFEDRIEEALQRYQQARSLAKRIGEADSEAIATTNVIESLVMLGRLEEASCLALEYHHPTAQLWAAHLTMLLEANPVELPVRETVSAWYQTLYDLTLTVQRLRSGAYPEVLQRCAEPHEDYAWWWDLLELNARLALNLETDDTLRRLNDPKPHPGIQRQIALEYALWLERFVRFEQPLPSSSTWLLIRHNLS